ncbi:MAG: PAS domain S-box protein [Thermomicrobiales bacterium]
MDQLAAFFKHCPFPAVQADLDGIITYWNPAAAALHGYSAAEAIGQHVTMLVPEELSDGPQRMVQLMRAGQVVENFETIALTRDGRRIPVALTIFPIRNAAGRVVGSGSISQDITERKIAERALVESERRFRAAFDVTPAAMSLIGLDGRFILVNQATCRTLGYSSVEMQGMPVTRVLPPDEAELDVVADLLQRGTSTDVDPELPLVRRDGFDLLGAHGRGGPGGRTGAAGVFPDARRGSDRAASSAGTARNGPGSPARHSRPRGQRLR